MQILNIIVYVSFKICTKNPTYALLWYFMVRNSTYSLELR